MALLKNLFGDGSKDRELAEDMRAVLAEMRQERERFAQLLETSHSAEDTLHKLGDPIARASEDASAATARLEELEQRLEAVTRIAGQVQELGERTERMSQDHQQTQGDMKSVLEDSGRVRAVFEELSQKVDLAVSLRERLETFLEVEKPFSLIHG